MNFLKFTRYTEWWEYKLVPLLTIGYAAIYINGYSFVHSIKQLLFLLLSIIAGAIYVSVINDVTDIEEDIKAGKKNNMASRKPWQRVLIVTVCLLTGLFLAYHIYPDTTSLFFYSMAWIVFSLYSIPPVRLKKRGIWGLFCDATGAHLFPTLLIIYNLAFIRDKTPAIGWTVATAIWALTCGLRGILWHQFRDRENDLAAGTNTFASHIDPKNFKLPERLLFIVEATAFAFFLFYIFNWLIFLSLILYFLLVLIRKKAFGTFTILIISPKSAPYQILMNEYYLVFLPLTLLVMISMHYNYGWIALCAHLILFPQTTMLIIKDYLKFLRSKLR